MLMGSEWGKYCLNVVANKDAFARLQINQVGGWLGGTQEEKSYIALGVRSIANFVPRVLPVVGGYSKRWVLTGPAEISEAIK
jgi:hypothetical protein